MKKVMKIQGMSCGHCKARVEKALNALDGVNASVNLEKAEAIIVLEKNITDEELSAVVTEAGYTVTSVNVKKGLFGK